jgi:hypothetical protein
MYLVAMAKKLVHFVTISYKRIIFMKTTTSVPLKGRLQALTTELRPARDKHSNLLRTLVIYGRKKFNEFGLRS